MKVISKKNDMARGFDHTHLPVNKNGATKTRLETRAIVMALERKIKTGFEHARTTYNIIYSLH